jgi:hypothetical protein
MTAYPELIRYPYMNGIPSDNGILGNWFSQAVTKSHIPIAGASSTHRLGTCAQSPDANPCLKVDRLH